MIYIHTSFILEIIYHFQSALKGLQLGGLNIVSVTDKTQDTTSVRPKKQRRL